MKLCLIIADQLFASHPAFDVDCDFVMVESEFLTSKFRYHKFKLAYIMASMREYANYLESKNKKVYYTKLSDQSKDFEATLSDLCKEKKYDELVICEIADHYFQKYLAQICADLKIKLTILESPMFLTPKIDFADFVLSKSGKRLLMNDFYIKQRIKLNILVDTNSKPVGGKWSFDEQNRKKLPKNVDIPKRQTTFTSKHYGDVSKLVQSHFPSNPGELLANSWLPLTHAQANEYLNHFIDNFAYSFGDYEDAMTTRSDTLFHSCLSALMNNGLLTPKQVIEAVLQADIPLNSKEGFVRQIIGWREWIKGMYDHVYKDDFLKLNFFEANNDLPDYFYRPNDTVLENNLPLKITLDKVSRLAYCHHIERLMILANWMTLSEYNPAQCYNWFVEMFIDSSEWVMVANVMGMGLYADGGIFATKPYVGGGNYIKKMSDYPSGKGGKDWEKLWTEKFWNFVLKHEKVFVSNPRMNMLIKAKKKTL